MSDNTASNGGGTCAWGLPTAISHSLLPTIAIYVQNDATLNGVTSVFRDNVADSGGAIEIYEHVNVTFDHAVFDNNTATVRMLPSLCLLR